MDGIQVYYIKNSDYYLYVTYTGDTSSMQGIIYLYTSKTQSQIDTDGGIYVGLGLGANDMTNADMVICQYFPGPKYSCADYFSYGESAPSLDTQLKGINDVTLVNSNISSLDSSFSPYLSLITITFKKNVSNPDKYDWSSIGSWKTSNAAMIKMEVLLNILLQVEEVSK
jgi:hypothetical protein